uniref:Uncharacterized protein n=1 Tax=Glossina austeni TaxID=7395 RepID=A0A1A9V670_GLOAU
MTTNDNRLRYLKYPEAISLLECVNCRSDEKLTKNNSPLTTTYTSDTAIQMLAAPLTLHLQVRVFTWSTISHNDFDDDISISSSSSSSISSSSSSSSSISNNKSSRYSFCCGHNAVFDCNEAVVRV